MSDVKFSISDVQGLIPKSDLELLCTKKLLVEITVIRPNDNASESGLSPKFAVGMHFSPTDEMNEKDESYDYPAYPDRLFSLDELVDMMKAFGIDPDSKVWQVMQDPNAERGKPHIINDLSQVRPVEK